MFGDITACFAGLLHRGPKIPEQYVLPSLYANNGSGYSSVDLKKLKRLIQEGRLTPCFPGCESSSGSPEIGSMKNLVKKILRSKEVDDTLEDALEECPICFMYYVVLNTSGCCNKRVCTECFLQIQTSASASGRLLCPFCKVPGYTAKFVGAKTAEEHECERVEEQKVIEARIREREDELRRDRERAEQREQEQAERLQQEQQRAEQQELEQEVTSPDDVTVAVPLGSAAAVADVASTTQADATAATVHSSDSHVGSTVASGPNDSSSNREQRSAASAANIPEDTRQQDGNAVTHAAMAPEGRGSGGQQRGQPLQHTRSDVGRFHLTDYVPREMRDIGMSNVEEMNDFMLEQALYESALAAGLERPPGLEDPDAEDDDGPWEHQIDDSNVEESEQALSQEAEVEAQRSSHSQHYDEKVTESSPAAPPGELDNGHQDPPQSDLDPHRDSDNSAEVTTDLESSDQPLESMRVPPSQTAAAAATEATAATALEAGIDGDGEELHERLEEDEGDAAVAILAASALMNGEHLDDMQSGHDMDGPQGSLQGPGVDDPKDSMGQQQGEQLASCHLVAEDQAASQGVADVEYQVAPSTAVASVTPGPSAPDMINFSDDDDDCILGEQPGAGDLHKAAIAPVILPPSTSPAATETDADIVANSAAIVGAGAIPTSRSLGKGDAQNQVTAEESLPAPRLKEGECPTRDACVATTSLLQNETSAEQAPGQPHPVPPHASDLPLSPSIPDLSQSSLEPPSAGPQHESLVTVSEFSSSVPEMEPNREAAEKLLEPQSSAAVLNQLLDSATSQPCLEGVTTMKVSSVQALSSDAADATSALPVALSDGAVLSAPTDALGSGQTVLVVGGVEQTQPVGMVAVAATAVGAKGAVAVVSGAKEEDSKVRHAAAPPAAPPRVHPRQLPRSSSLVPGRAPPPPPAQAPYKAASATPVLLATAAAAGAVGAASVSMSDEADAPTDTVLIQEDRSSSALRMADSQLQQAADASMDLISSHQPSNLQIESTPLVSRNIQDVDVLAVPSVVDVLAVPLSTAPSSTHATGQASLAVPSEADNTESEVAESLTAVEAGAGIDAACLTQSKPSVTHADISRPCYTLADEGLHTVEAAQAPQIPPSQTDAEFIQMSEFPPPSQPRTEAAQDSRSSGLYPGSEAQKPAAMRNDGLQAHSHQDDAQALSLDAHQEGDSQVISLKGDTDEAHADGEGGDTCSVSDSVQDSNLSRCDSHYSHNGSEVPSVEEVLEVTVEDIKMVEMVNPSFDCSPPSSASSGTRTLQHINSYVSPRSDWVSPHSNWSGKSPNGQQEQSPWRPYPAPWDTGSSSTIGAILNSPRSPTDARGAMPSPNKATRIPHSSSFNNPLHESPECMDTQAVPSQVRLPFAGIQSPTKAPVADPSRVIYLTPRPSGQGRQHLNETDEPGANLPYTTAMVTSSVTPSPSGLQQDNPQTTSSTWELTGSHGDAHVHSRRAQLGVLDGGSTAALVHGSTNSCVANNSEGELNGALSVGAGVCVPAGSATHHAHMTQDWKPDPMPRGHELGPNNEVQLNDRSQGDNLDAADFAFSRSPGAGESKQAPVHDVDLDPVQANGTKVEGAEEPGSTGNGAASSTVVHVPLKTLIAQLAAQGEVDASEKVKVVGMLHGHVINSAPTDAKADEVDPGNYPVVVNPDGSMSLLLPADHEERALKLEEERRRQEQLRAQEQGYIPDDRALISAEAEIMNAGYGDQEISYPYYDRPFPAENRPAQAGSLMASIAEADARVAACIAREDQGLRQHLASRGNVENVVPGNNESAQR